MIPTKVGFVLLSNSSSPIPSTRISVLNMFPFLRDANFDPHIVFEPKDAEERPDLTGLYPRILLEGFHIIYFQKTHGRSAETLAKQLSEAGIKTIYGVCDLVDEGMAEATDTTIVVTDYLKSLYPQTLHSKLRVVHDGIEHSGKYRSDYDINHGSCVDSLHAILVTSSSLDHLPVLDVIPEWLKITIVGRYPQQIVQRFRSAYWQLKCRNGFTQRMSYLRFLTNPNIRCIGWDPIGVYEAMGQADIGIIPIQTSVGHELDKFPPAWKVKSENRLTMKMCFGLPVIATPIPSYEPIIVQGKNGFLANNRQEWIDYLDALRDVKLRKNIGECARQYVLEKFSMEEQARLLIDVFRDLLV